MQAPAAPRDMLGSAAVTLAAAAALPAVPLVALAAALADGLFPDASAATARPRYRVEEEGIVAEALAGRGSSLAAQLRVLLPMARICAIRGTAL